MTTYIHVGKNPEGCSMYLLGQQIADNSGASLATTTLPPDAEKVVTIVPEDIPRLTALKRFSKLKEIVLLMGANWEEYDLWMRGALLAWGTRNKIVVHSPYSHAEVLKTARAMVAPAKLRELHKNLILIPYGVDPIFQPTKEGRSGNNWIVPYNRINQTYKNINQHQFISTRFEVLTRGEVDHLFILNEGMSGDREERHKMPEYRIVSQPDSREGYQSLIADRGGFLCTSHTESFGIYYLELLCSGVVGVFLRKPWVTALLPDYPLVADTEEEALGMMVDVRDHYDKWYGRMEAEIIPFIRKTYDLSRFAKEVVSI